MPDGKEGVPGLAASSGGGLSRRGCTLAQDDGGPQFSPGKGRILTEVGLTSMLFHLTSGDRTV